MAMDWKPPLKADDFPRTGKDVLDSGDMTVDHRDLLLAVKQAGPHHSSSGEERDSGSWMIIILN